MMNNLVHSEKTIKRLVEVSRYYYIDRLSQSEISKKLNISRPTISRDLKLAQDIGIVDIHVNNPLKQNESLKKQLISKYQLKDVIIASQTNEHEDIIVESLGEIGARYLSTIVKDGDIIGINWGQTMEALANKLNPFHNINVKLVQLKGSVSNSTENNYATEITNKFNIAFNTQTQVLPLPVIFDNANTKKLTMNDRFISSVMHEVYSSNIAIFTVGTTEPDAKLFKLGYLSSKEIEYLRKNSVGDIISHFVDENGEIADKNLDSRTIAIPLENLKKKEYSILIAGGNRKLKPIHSALVGGYVNVLITNQKIAESLINI